MALNVRPILSYIPAFDAEFGESDKNKGHLKAPIFSFSWTEGVVRKNRLRILDYNTKEEVYNCKIATMSRTHQLHKVLNENESIEQSTLYNLKNGHKYMAYLSVFTVDDIESEPSEAVIFHCIKMPEFRFTNFTNFTGDGENAIAIVESSSLHCVVDYTQDINEKENLSSYYYELKDYNGKTIYKSATKYVSSWDTTLRFSIGGVDENVTTSGEIKYDEAYTIICVGETQHGLILYTDQKFIVKVPATGVGALIQVENVGDGRVLISSNYKIMDGICSNENPTYVYDSEGNPYAIDLTQGDYVEFTEGFTMYVPYELIVKGDFGVGKLITLRGKESINGTNNFKDIYGYLSLKTIDYTTFRYYYFSFETEKNGIVHEVRTNYFVSKDELITAEIDLSFYNGWYNIKANVKYDEKYVDITNENNDVLLKLLDEYSLSDDNLGNIKLTINSITVSDDGIGNVALI